MLIGKEQCCCCCFLLGWCSIKTIFTSTTTNTFERSQWSCTTCSCQSRQCIRITQSNSCSNWSNLCRTSQWIEKQRWSFVQVREREKKSSTRNWFFFVWFSRETYLLALKNCLTAVASKVSDDVKKQIEQALVSCQSNENDLVRQLASNCKEILLSVH